jgi:UDP-GlcNAc:undecaprenyl-phosphate/decaprenyl-phosphate GlcNAc-1-phosphate transferase
MKNFTVIAGTIAISLLLTYITRTVMTRLGVVAAPRKDRWHSKPTALLGGIAIYTSFILSVLLVFPDPFSIKRLLLAGTLLFVVGLIDDLIQIKPYVKLAAQLVASSALIFSGHYLPWTHIPLLDFVITFIWLVGITNAINMLDNMDGLAGGISVIACLFLSLNFYLNGQAGFIYLPLIMAASIAGFLVFNFNPASIFMGDCGSMFIGFTVSGMALYSVEQRTRNLAAVLATPVLIMLMPIFDTTIVTIARKINGRPVSQGGRDHTSHRLVALGMTDRQAVLTLYVISLIAGGLAIVVRDLPIGVGIAIIASSVLTIIFLGFYLGKVGVYEETDAPAGTLIRKISSHPYRRRLVEVLIDFILVSLSYYVSYLLRFDGELPAEQFAIFIRTLPYTIAIHLFCFLLFGMYRGIWQYAGVEELAGIGKGTLAGSIVSISFVMLLYKFAGPSRSIFIINLVLLTLVIGISRLSFRLFSIILPGGPSPQPGSRPVLIYGAGDRGELLLRELLQNQAHLYVPVGFVDDDPAKIGKTLRGYAIHDTASLPRLTRDLQIKEVLLSTTKISEADIDRLRAIGIRLLRPKIGFE